MKLASKTRENSTGRGNAQCRRVTDQAQYLQTPMKINQTPPQERGTRPIHLRQRPLRYHRNLRHESAESLAEGKASMPHLGQHK